MRPLPRSRAAAQESGPSTSGRGQGEGGDAANQSVQDVAASLKRKAKDGSLGGGRMAPNAGAGGKAGARSFLSPEVDAQGMGGDERAAKIKKKKQREGDEGEELRSKKAKKHAA